MIMDKTDLIAELYAFIKGANQVKPFDSTEELIDLYKNTFPNRTKAQLDYVTQHIQGRFI